jgi:hypothetical protein
VEAWVGPGKLADNLTVAIVLALASTSWRTDEVDVLEVGIVKFDRATAVFLKASWVVGGHRGAVRSRQQPITVHR